MNPSGWGDGFEFPVVPGLDGLHTQSPESTPLSLMQGQPEVAMSLALDDALSTPALFATGGSQRTPALASGTTSTQASPITMPHSVTPLTYLRGDGTASRTPLQILKKPKRNSSLPDSKTKLLSMTPVNVDQCDDKSMVNLCRDEVDHSLPYSRVLESYRYHLGDTSPGRRTRSPFDAGCGLVGTFQLKPAVQPNSRITIRGDTRMLAVGIMTHNIMSNKVPLMELYRDADTGTWNLWEGDEPTGWVVPESIHDLKWLSNNTLVIASGASLYFLPLNTASRFSALRPKPDMRLLTAHQITPISGSSMIREIEPLFDGTSVLVGDQSGLFSIVRQDPRMCVSYHFSEPVSSVRNMPQSHFRHCVSCTLESGRMCVFDTRMQWAPCMEVVVQGAGESSALFTHDWHGDIAVFGFSSGVLKSARFCTGGSGESMRGIKPVLAAITNEGKMSPGVIRAHPTRDEFVTFGLNSLGVGKISTCDLWFTPKDFFIYQHCVMGQYFEDNSIITLSDSCYFQIWTVV